MLVLLLVLALLAGCTTLGYYGQAVRGHLELTFKRRSIDRLLAADDTPAALRERLAFVREARSFAIRELALPDSGSYTDYADLERDVTVWLVVAAPEFSLEPKRWCYPIAGCLSYRGYFRRDAAEREAARLAADGLETTLSPAIAYSTLGFMDDPVLNTMLAYDDLALAGLLFHELAHEVVFVSGDTVFNESFATAVEKLGRDRFAASLGVSTEADDAAVRAEREAAFTALLLEVRAELEALYGSDVPESEMAAEKTAIGAALSDRYEVFKEVWDGYTGFDHWFAEGPPNNARLSLVATYELEVPAFEALFDAVGQDFTAFYAEVEELAGVPEAERHARLDALSPP